MKTWYFLLSFIYVLIFSHIIQADLFEGLLGLNENVPNINSAAPVSHPTSPPVNHPPSKPNTSPDTKENPDPNHKIQSPVQSSSTTQPISSDPPPPPHISSSEPSSNNPPSSPPSSSTPPASSSNIDTSSPTVEAPPSSQSNKNTPHSTTGAPSTATTDTPNDTPSKSHSPGNGNTAPSRSTNNAKAKNSNENNVSSSSVGVISPTITTSILPDEPSPSSDSAQNSGSGTIAGAIVGCVVGLALIAGIVLWCKKRGSAKRQNGISDDKFRPAEDYSIDMHPHSAPSPGMGKTVLPGNNNGMMDMPAPMAFDYSRRLVGGAATGAATPAPPPGVPVYSDDYHLQQQQQEYEQPDYHQQEYHQQQMPPQDYHQQMPLQDYHHQQMPPPQDYQQQQYNAHHDGLMGGDQMHAQDLNLTGEGAAGYYYQPELTKWDYDHQLPQNNYDNHTVDSSGVGGMMNDPNATYYHDPYHKPEIVDQHAYKPNAI